MLDFTAERINFLWFAIDETVGCPHCTYTHSSTRVHFATAVAALSLCCQFDAIVTDPPFGKREKAMGSTPDEPMGDSRLTLAHLLVIASHRVKSGGRLVFWMPTAGFVTDDEVRDQLTQLEKQADQYCRAAGLGLVSDVLLFERATPQDLNSKLWRWLCVYKRL